MQQRSLGVDGVGDNSGTSVLVSDEDGTLIICDQALLIELLGREGRDIRAGEGSYECDTADTGDTENGSQKRGKQLLSSFHTAHALSYFDQAASEAGAGDQGQGEGKAFTGRPYRRNR